jgi:hypothetical protein
MAKNETRKMVRNVLEEDEVAFDALQKINGYTPANPAYTLAAVTQAFGEMNTAKTLANQAEAAFATAEDIATAKEWAFHNMMLGVKEQIIAQFGKDSLQLQELGLKRKSEYRGRKPKAPTSPKPVS